MTTQAQSSIHLPRVEIKFCVQCKWNLRAAYYAQELLQTFSNTIGEIALVPVTGGIFTVTLTYASVQSSSDTNIETKLESEPYTLISPATDPAASPHSPQVTRTTTTQIWDRKTDGGFPETKELKNRIRNLIDPDKDMGHIDRSLKKSQASTSQKAETQSKPEPEPQQAQPPPPPAKQDTRPPGPSSTPSHHNTTHPRTEPDSRATTAPPAPAPAPAPLSPPSTTARTLTAAPISWAMQEQMYADNDTESMHDCEDCRLAAMESLEDEIGRVTSYQRQSREERRWE